MKNIFKHISFVMFTGFIIINLNNQCVLASEPEEEITEDERYEEIIEDYEDFTEEEEYYYDEAPAMQSMGIMPMALTYLTTYKGSDYYKENATATYTLSGNIKAYFFSGSGFLYISGSGDMPDYTYSSKPPWEGYKSSITDAKISDGITSAGGYLFYGYTSLVNVEMPDSITKIGLATFADCSNLVNTGGLPANLSYISDWAFQQCGKLVLTDVLPQGLEHIGQYAFTYNYECRISDPLPDSIKIIDNCAFFGCRNLALSGSLPSSLETIGGSAFSVCPEIAFTGSLPSSLKYVGDSAFRDCKKLAISGSLPQGLETLKWACFYGCENLAITGSLPSSLTTIDDNIFEGCNASKTHFNVNNTSITIEAIMKIPIEYYVEDRVKTVDGMFLGNKTYYGNALYSPRTYPSDRSYEGYEYLYPEDYSIYPTLLPNGGTPQTIYTLWDVEVYYTIRVPASCEFHYSIENDRFEGTLTMYVKGQLNCNKKLKIYPGTGTEYMWGDSTNTRISVNAVQNISEFVDENPQDGQSAIRKDEETAVTLNLDTNYTVLDVYRGNIYLGWETNRIRWY